MSRRLLAVALLLLACSGKDGKVDPPTEPGTAAPLSPAPSPAPSPSSATPSTGTATPNAFLAAGQPTFIIGTTGSDAEDRDIAGQARFLRGVLFPDAPLLADTALDPAAWPPRPVVYGGPQVNAALAGPLPFHMTADRLVIGDDTFEGEGILFITVLPADGTRPELLLFAGTGPLGVAEINSMMAGGNHPLLVADTFGTLATGRWVRGDDGVWHADLGPRARRIPWRSVEVRPRGHGPFTIRFPEQLPATPEDDAATQAISRAMGRLAIKLALSLPPMTFYVYPDPRSKQSLTGKGGDGHAVPSSRALHVRRADPAAGGPLENLIVHEGTHVIARITWGAPGSALLGEGLAVWASGQYGGRTLEQWKPQVVRRPIASLLGAAFHKTPEPETYPLAGLLVEAALGVVGRERFLQHLYPATAAEWPEACRRAGTTPEALEQKLTALLAR